METSFASASSREVEDLLRASARDVERIFHRFRIPPGEQDDLVQDTLLAYLRKRHEVLAPAAWFLGALRFRCLTYWRRRRRSLLEAVDYTLLDALAEPVAGDAERRDLRRDLSSLVSKLSARCRDLLHLRYGLECDLPEAARRLGYRPSGIRQVASRCLAALTRQMVAGGFDEPPLDEGT